METILKLFEELAPMAEAWLREIIRDEQMKVLAEDHEQAKPEKFLSRTEVCQLLNISKVTLWKLAKEKRIEPVKVGRRVLFKETDVRNFQNT